jgi:uncharacterized membrane protein YkvA (DUF1232 family)
MLDPNRVTVEIPSISVTAGIERDLLNNGIHVNSSNSDSDLDSILDGEEDILESEIKNLVRNKFIHEYSRNNALFSEDIEREVVIEVRDDLGNPNPQTLATFEFDKSSSTGQIHFTVSAHLICSEFFKAHGKELRDYHLLDKGYWSHELVHLRDWEYLTRASQLLEQTGDRSPMKKVRLTSLSAGRQFFSTSEDYTLGELQVLVLSSLAAYRDEGLAVLYEYLCGERKLLSSKIEGAVILFRKDFYSLASMVLKVSESTSSNPYERNKRISDVLEKMKDTAYSIGPFWVADGLFSLSQEDDSSLSEGVVKNIAAMVESMASGSETTVSRADAAEIVNAGLKLDLGAYLDLLTRQDMEHPWGAFLNMDDLAYIFSLLTVQDFDRSLRLIENLQQASKNRDLELFTETLTEIIGGMAMTDDELAEELTQWKTGRTAESPLDRELEKHATALMAALERKDFGRGIAVLALTYLFDPDDYISDDVAFMGIMDDLYVLRTACTLLAKSC